MENIHIDEEFEEIAVRMFNEINQLPVCPACGAELVSIVEDSTDGWVFKKICPLQKSTGCQV